MSKDILHVVETKTGSDVKMTLLRGLPDSKFLRIHELLRTTKDGIKVYKPKGQ